MVKLETADSDQLPQGWARAPVSQVIEDVQPGFASGEKNVNSGVAHLRMNNIGLRGELVLDLVRKVPEGLARPQHNLQPGDVLVCTTNSGKLVGKCAYFDLRGRYAFSNHLTRLRPKAGVIDGKFLRWSLWLDWKRRAFDDKCKHWVNQSTLPKEALLENPVVVPPLAEQRRIVAKLETLLGKVDACQHRLAKIPLLLKRFRQSVHAAACSGRLTADWREENPPTRPAIEALHEHARQTEGRERNMRRTKPAKGLTLLDYSDGFPPAWAWLKVRELVEKGAIFDVQDGNHGELYPRAEDFGDAGVRYISAEHVINDRVQIDSAPFLKPEKARQLRIGFARANDVILTHNATVGRVALLPPGSPDVVLSTSTTYYRVDETVLIARYLAAFLRSNFFQGQLEAVMEQTTRNQVSVTKQVEFGVAVPPLAEQHEIVHRVEALFGLADQIEARFQKAQAQVDKLTPSLLARAFRGQLVPQDPNDEPAERLLERIKSAGQE